LHAFHAGAKEYGIELSAVNCEHGIRGESSRRDTEFVKKLCAEWNIPLFEFSAEIKSLAREHGRGLEEEGRLFRYECFHRLRKEGKTDFVATAHHRGDFAETVLFRLARGTSLSGLNCFPPQEGILRPLLFVSRGEIEAYIEEYALPYVNDETNDDTAYSRNLIRKEALPALSKAAKGAEENLVAFARRAVRDDEYLYSLAVEHVRRKDGALFVPVDLPEALFSRACLYAIKELDIKKDYTETNLQDLRSLSELQSGSRVSLPCGIEAAREQGEIAFYRPHVPFSGEIPFSIGRFQTESFIIAVQEAGEEGLRADFDAFGEGCVIRTRREGDYIVPYGSGRKSLKKFLSDKKIPSRVGRELALVARGNEVLAVFGVEISDTVKITQNTKRAVRLVTF